MKNKLWLALFFLFFFFYRIRNFTRSNTFAVNQLYHKSIFKRNSQRRFFEKREYRTVEIFFFFFVRRARVIHPTLLYFYFLLFCSRFSPSPTLPFILQRWCVLFFFFFFFRKNSSTKMFDLFAPSLWNFSNIRETSRSSPLFRTVITLFYNNY